MTSKEKAYDLVILFTDKHNNVRKDLAKKFALIAVNEILKSEPRSPSDVDWDDVGGEYNYYFAAQLEDAEKYWLEVKQEIEKL
jgi:hypothetical protein